MTRLNEDIPVEKPRGDLVASVEEAQPVAPDKDETAKADQAVDAKKPAKKPDQKKPLPNDAGGEERLQPANVIALISGRDHAGKAVIRVKWETLPQTLGDAKDGIRFTADVTDPLGKTKYRKMVNRADNIMVDGVPVSADGISKIRLMITETHTDGKVVQGWSEVLVPMGKQA